MSERSIVVNMSHSNKIHGYDGLKSSENNDEWPIITYAENTQKSLQALLYEAARGDEKIAKTKWEAFTQGIKQNKPSKEQIELIITHWDEENQWTPLHYAVYCNNMMIFDKLTHKDECFKCGMLLLNFNSISMKIYLDININGGNGENVFHIAAQSVAIWSNWEKNPSKPKLPEIVDRMFKLGADVNDLDDENRTPLHLAVQYNRYNFAECLIGAGANVTALTKLRANVLHFALIPGGEATSEELMKMIGLILNNQKDRNVDLVKQCTVEGSTALAFAMCHPQASEALIEKLTFIDEKYLLMALNMLASRRRFNIGNNKQMDYLKSFVDQLASCGNETIKQIFHIICRYDNKDLLDHFYKKDKFKDNIDTPDHAGYTPLLTGVFYNAQSCVEWLLKNSDCFINIMSRNHEGENILHICAKRKVDEKLFEMIWGKLIDVDKLALVIQTDVDGNIPLYAAVRVNNEYVYDKLLKDTLTSQRSEQIKRNQTWKRTVFHEIANSGHKKLLFKIKSDSNSSLPHMDWNSMQLKQQLHVRDEKGYTCLHIAAANDHLSIVEYLIDTAAMDVDVIADRRITPLHVACAKGHVKIVEYLLEKNASTTLRNAQSYNCLELAITNQHEEIVKKLMEHSSWRQMMKNAQPIDDTEAYDTPMRKMIRYMPDVAVWVIDNKLTTVIGGPGQKVHKIAYDYEFYEDMIEVKDWCDQGFKAPEETPTCNTICRKRGAGAIFSCWCCCRGHSSNSCCSFGKENSDLLSRFYTTDAYTLVRNHPLFIANLQEDCPDLTEHDYNTFLRLEKLRSFGLVLFIASFFIYIAYLVLLTTVIVKGKHPKYFYDRANISMTNDLETCQSVSYYFLNNVNRTDEAFKTVDYKILKMALYIIMSTFIMKNLIVMGTLFPKVFRTGASYIEIAALVLTFVYVLDWFDWQSEILFRCPVQYQLGAFGILIAYINFLLYVRTAPIFDLGIYILMLEVITTKFIRFLIVLLIVISGFGLCYWMLLQNQTVYGTPAEAIMRTGLMLFDLGYESRLYTPDSGGVGYYNVIYLVFILTAIALPVFITNLMIGLAVGEIPSLMTQGTLWRTTLMYHILSDYEIMRIQFNHFINAFAYFFCCNRRRSWFISKPYTILQKNVKSGRMGKLAVAWIYVKKNFIDQQIQDSIKRKVSKTTQTTAKEAQV